MMEKFLILCLMSLFGMTSKAFAAAQPGDGPNQCADTLEECSFIIDENNTLVISGNGAVSGAQYGLSGSLSSTMQNAYTVVVNEGITNIDNLHRIGCITTDCLSRDSNNRLTDVYIPASVTQIGADAFVHSFISNLVLAGEDTEIDPQALANIRSVRNTCVSQTIFGSVECPPFEYTTTISCVKGSKTEERIKALIGDNPRFSLGYIEEKSGRTFYTPKEASEHVNHTNNNKITFTFK